MLLASLCFGVKDILAQGFPPNPAGVRAQPTNNIYSRRGPLPGNPTYDSENNEVDKVLSDEFEETVKTTRFRPTNERKSPPGNPRPVADSNANSLDVNYNDRVQIQLNVNRAKGPNSSYAGSDETDNNNDGVISPTKDEASLQNNDVQKIGWNSQALKTLAGEVADSVLAEADKLFVALGKGSFSREPTSQLQPASSSSPFPSDDVGNYIIC